MRYADIAAIMPVTNTATTTRQNEQRLIDHNLLAQKGVVPTGKGQITAEALTNTPEMQQAVKADKEKRDRERRERKKRKFETGEAPHGPLAKLFDADAEDESTFDASL
jgi:hypothetical protein